MNISLMFALMPVCVYVFVCLPKCSMNKLPIISEHYGRIKTTRRPGKYINGRLNEAERDVSGGRHVQSSSRAGYKETR